LSRVFNYISWPVITGLLAAGLIILLFPSLLQKPGPTPAGRELTRTLSAPGWEGPTSYADAVSRAAPSVVNIYTSKTLTRPRHPLLDDPFFRRFFNSSNLPQQQRMESSLGSGVIINDHGFILTNNHVVSGADQIVVLLHDGREAEARIAGTDAETDLAVLKIELDDLVPINIGNPAQTRIGDVVLAIGNPFGLGQSVSLGIVSATGRNGLGLNTYENFIQTDAAINPGNSGGALVDTAGNLVGINSAILDESSSVRIGFAIPADTAVKVLQDIVDHGRVIRGWLGVQARQLSATAAVRMGLNPPRGLIITDIHLNGPAHLAGLRPGDVITRINQQQVGDGNQGMNLIANLKPGDPIRIDVVRGGENITITAVAGTRPQLQ